MDEKQKRAIKIMIGLFVGGFAAGALVASLVWTIAVLAAT